MSYYRICPNCGKGTTVRYEDERKKREEKEKAERKKQKKLQEAAIINNFKEGTK